MTFKFGIIGNGFVGKATRLLTSKNHEVKIYDVDPEKCYPPNIRLADLTDCSIIFVAVPTPSNPDGSCHLELVKSVVRSIRALNICAHVVIRSTVVIGTCDELDCYFMPEFLTEKNWAEDVYHCRNWIVGTCAESNNANTTDVKDFMEKMTALISDACDEGAVQYNNITFVSNKEAEMIKYYRNTFLAVKVSYSNEMHEFCKTRGIDYETVRRVATQDDRIGSSHTVVPGPDGHFGFGGTCFPKDTHSLLYQFETAGTKSYILRSAVQRNNEHDRPEKDWMDDVGRAFITQIPQRKEVD
jgi:nucleotide sugar dehydrogenase